MYHYYRKGKLKVVSIAERVKKQGLPAKVNLRNSPLFI